MGLSSRRRRAPCALPQTYSDGQSLFERLIQQHIHLPDATAERAQRMGFGLAAVHINKHIPWRYDARLGPKITDQRSASVCGDTKIAGGMKFSAAKLRSFPREKRAGSR